MVTVASAVTAVILGSIFVVIPSFAERTVTYEKLLDVKKEFLFLALTDIKNYGQVFPENIKNILGKS